MRLLKLDEHGEPVLAQDYRNESLPPYAILSHTWHADDQEVTFEELSQGLGQHKAGFNKIRFCGRQARKDNLTYFWVDSCCIDKRHSAELSEAINSMFNWYQNAAKCYVYLADVSALKRKSDGHAEPWEQSFRHSKWHQRGWTLQELIAPENVSFYSREERWLGDKNSLEALIHQVTRIPVEALQGAPLTHFPVDERLRWAANRRTTKPEDQAYCLFGIFDVFLSPIYGEGAHALVRLKRAVSAHGHDFDETLLNNNPPASSVSSDVSASDANARRREKMVALGFEQMDARRATIKDAQPKTCEWLLTHPVYMAWNNVDAGRHSRCIIWINGKPGAGKSTLVKYALSHAQRKKRSDEILISFFFNARGDELERSTEGMYRTMLLQLLSAAPDLQKALDYENPFAPGIDQDLSWSLARTRQTFAEAVAQLGQRRLKCFIDALDECDEQQVRDMVAFFEELVERSFGEDYQLLICFASRHYPSIDVEHAQHLILEDEAGHDDDMARYIRRHLRAGSGKLLQDLHAQIQENANGVFLWAVLVVDILKRDLESGRMFAMKKQLQDLKNRLQQIPKGLSELFKDILRRDSANMDELVLALQWILFARRPLKREEFYFAMAAELGSSTEQSHVWEPEAWDPEYITADMMSRYVLNASKGLAELTKAKPHTVQFIHESVRDFLLRDGGLAEIISIGGSNLGSSAHEKLKWCCHKYLRIDLRGRYDPLFTEFTKEDRQKACEEFPFLQYASQNILYHANAAATDISQTPFLADFPLFKWIEVTNLLERAGIRRHDIDAGIVYILAEQGLATLIENIKETEDNGKIPDSKLYDRQQRFGHAVIAAFANGHEAALKVLLINMIPACPNVKILEHPDFSKIMKHPDFGKIGKVTGLSNGQSLPQWAVRTGKGALAKFIISNMSEDAIESNFARLLELAAKYNSEALEAILARRMNPDTKALRFLDPTLLQKAVACNDVDTVELLIKGGVDLNQTSVDETPLAVASRNGNDRMMHLLLQAGTDINALDSRGRTSLICAVCNNDSKLVQLLLAAGASVNVVDSSGQTSLIHATWQGAKEVVSQLLAAGAEVDAKGKDGDTSLAKAVSRGDAETVSLLLAAGASIEARGAAGETSLIRAAYLGYHAVILQLLAASANVNAQDNRGSTCLIKAADCGHSDVVSQLLDAGADVNARDGQGYTSLSKAAFHGHSDVLSQLLAAGADLEARNPAGWPTDHPVVYLCSYNEKPERPDTNAPENQAWTSLMVAARLGHSDIVSQLLAAGADVKAKDWEGRTSLTEAALSGHSDVVWQLLAAGADANARDNQGNTSLTIAAGNGDNRIVSQLVAAGADVNAKGFLDRTSLFRATLSDSSDIVSQLLAAGADVDARDSFKMTSLIEAARRGNSDITSQLLAAGADANIGDDCGSTSLMSAARGGYSNIVSQLLAVGADINARDNQGYTSLMAAASGGYSDIISQLLAAGAEVNTTTNQGHTSLLKAARGGNHRVVSQLLVAGANVNAQDNEGCNSLAAAAVGGYSDIVSQLLAAGADVNARDTYGFTSLMGAASGGYSDTTSQLIAAGADVNARDEQGNTSLTFAARWGHGEVVSRLQAAIADADTQDLQGEISTAEAAIVVDGDGHTEIMSALGGAGVETDSDCASS